MAQRTQIDVHDDGTPFTQAAYACLLEHGLDGAGQALRILVDQASRIERALELELTLLTLARKLGVPTKTLSAAVNSGRGENVARYVNRYRIEHACALLRAGQAVTSALYDSGFNTKSNFHREFQRVHQLTPSEWLEQEAPAHGAMGAAAKQ